jgi:hypothetical protein
VHHAILPQCLGEDQATVADCRTKETLLALVVIFMRVTVVGDISIESHLPEVNECGLFSAPEREF